MMVAHPELLLDWCAVASHRRYAEDAVASSVFWDRYAAHWRGLVTAVLQFDTNLCPVFSHEGWEVPDLHAVDACSSFVPLHLLPGDFEVLGLEDIDQCVSTGVRCLRLCPIFYAHRAVRLFEFRRGARVDSPLLVRPFLVRACGFRSLSGHLPAPRFTLQVVWPLLTSRPSPKTLLPSALPLSRPHVVEISPGNCENLRHPSASFTSGTE